MKRMLLVVMSLVMILGLCSFAPPDDPVSPDYLYTSRCSSLLSISGLNATCTSNLIGYYGETTKIVVTQTLQVKDGNQWRTSSSWSHTYYDYSCQFTNSKTVYSGNTYRVKSEFKVYAGTNYETVYSYSTTKKT